MVNISRIKSGIPGLDGLIEGGIPKKAAVIVSGGPGAGKTNLCLQYLYYGATHGEPGVYITFEEDPKELEIAASRFGWNISKLVKENKIVIEKVREAKDVTDLFKKVEQIVKKVKAKRLVIDSLASVTIYATTFESIIKDLPVGARVTDRTLPIVPSEDAIVRRTMYKVIDFLKGLGVTALLPSESEDSQFSRYGIEEFVVDGLIALHYSSIGSKLFGNIEVRKMRKTKHIHGVFDYTIGDKGVKVLPEKGASAIMK